MKLGLIDAEVVNDVCEKWVGGGGQDVAREAGAGEDAVIEIDIATTDEIHERDMKGGGCNQRGDWRWLRGWYWWS